MHWLERTELLVGKEKLDRLRNANILIVGLGGVGSYAAEMLCRAGVGRMTLADSDVFEETNRNRQLAALISTTGKYKAEILAQRFRDINPDIQLNIVTDFIRDEKTEKLLDKERYDYVVDAIDTLSPKVFLICHSLKRGLRLVSSMGSGGKIDPARIRIADISESYNCRLARIIRKRLSKMGIKDGFKVIFSTEETGSHAIKPEDGLNKKSTVGTISYIPPVFGCFMASVVINDL
jgi:tRNA A37 threonylcarbamoyladenosine dehydratase